MNDLSCTGNMVESVLWAAFAIAFCVMAFRATGRRRRLSLTLAAAFLAFGVSDLIEAQTGAWWRPPWLFILKAGCVGVFAYGVWEYRRIRNTEAGRPNEPAGNGEPIPPEASRK
ncbi:MAG: hypothetical protein ACKVJX_23835 [Verrucomicrobiia bacterium]